MDSLQAFSGYGRTTRTTTTRAIGRFGVIQCITDCVFSELQDHSLNGDSLEGETIPGGTNLYGPYAAFTLASGIAIGHNKP